MLNKGNQTVNKISKKQKICSQKEILRILDKKSNNKKNRQELNIKNNQESNEYISKSI